MEPAGFAFAVVGVTELCLKYGGKLCALYRTFRDAEAGVAERILTLENRWLKIEAQVNFLHDIWPTLPPRFQIHFNGLLSVINAKLIEATTTLDSIIGRKTSPHPQISDIMRKEGHLRRGYFAFSIKDTLDDTIRDLDSWQRNLLDPSWYQLVLVPGKRVSQLASQRVSDRQDPTNVLSSLRNFANVDDVDPGRVDNALLPNDCVELLAAQIEFSESKLGIHKPSGTLVVMDAVHMPAQPDTKRATEEVLILLRRLSSVDVETFGFLHCRGALQNAQSFDFIFSFPKDFDDPTSLRRLLINADVTYPLNARVNLGQMLARSVAFLHTCHLVHKNVRPENIICFSTPGKYPDHPYLVGLERFRFIDAYSLRVSDDLWQRNIYRHPSRQGTRPERDYLMQHDIYSLGVCLLEIGLWKSFVTYNEDTDSISANEDFILPMHLAIKDPRRRAFQIKMNFTKLAQERLPGIMGQRYAGTVISCLTCLDPGNSDFGDESAVEDSDGILVGIRYIEKI